MWAFVNVSPVVIFGLTGKSCYVQPNIFLDSLDNATMAVMAKKRVGWVGLSLTVTAEIFYKMR